MLTSSKTRFTLVD